MTDSLASIYTRLTAKRPELAVPDLAHSKHHSHNNGWHRGDDHRGLTRWVGADEAEALILAHWIACLPEGHGLHRGLDNPNPRYYVYGGETETEPHGVSALTALAAFWEAR